MGNIVAVDHRQAPWRRHIGRHGRFLQHCAMMNTVNQLAQQMDGNQDLASMMAAMGGPGDGSGNMSSMVQQIMPFVSQALNSGSSSSNLLQRQPSRKPTLHRRHSSVKNLNVNERSSSDFRMNLENAAQKIVEQYPPIEIYSSIVETAALHNKVFDSALLMSYVWKRSLLRLEPTQNWLRNCFDAQNWPCLKAKSAEGVRVLLLVWDDPTSRSILGIKTQGVREPTMKKLGVFSSIHQ